MENHNVEEGNKMMSEMTKVKDGQQKNLDNGCSKALPFVPLVIALTTLLFYVVIYPMAVINGHVEPIWPYMSDAGTMPPEANYMTLISFILAILIFLHGLIRYRQVESVCKDKTITNQQREKILKLNKYNFSAYVITTFAIVFWASFRVSESPLIHFVVAIVVNLFGLVPMLIFETMITAATQPQAVTRRMAITRKVLLTLILIDYVICCVGLLWSAFAAKDSQQFLVAEKRMKWKSEDDGYYLHVLSALKNWTTTLMWAVFMATFYYDFKRCKVVNRDIKFETYK